jgi:uncharacterized repeat protein (TIGR02543 family)
MNRRRVSVKVLLYFLMMMLMVVTGGCSKSDDAPAPAATTTYTVTFDNQSATVAESPTSLTVTSPATTVGVLPTAPTKSGYTFAGWWTGTNGTGTEFTASTPVTASITVYAYWTTSTVYTVTFNSQGGTAVDAQHVVSGGTVALPANPTYEGYLFSSWNEAANGSGTQFTASIAVTGNITVYAQWASYSYTVTFDSQSATIAASPTSKTVASPATTVDALPTPPTKTSYTFAGWFTAASGGGTQFTASTVVTGNITVYAYWTTSTVYTVTYDSQGGSSVASQQVVSGGTVGTLPANPTRSGYTFGGWYTAVSGGGTAFTASTTVTASLTVYAKWTAVIGSSTATATYTWTSGTSTLVITWTGSNFICNGPPSSGAETETGVTITTTTMTWPSSNDGLGMTWTRSSGTANDPSGTWTSSADYEGNTFTAVVTATNSTSGTLSVSANITACGSGDYNPGAESSYQPGNSGSQYQVWLFYADGNNTASSVSVTGSGITGSDAFTYSNGEWDPASDINFGDTQPTLPLSYTYTVTDTSTWHKTISVSCFMKSLATITAPTSGGTVGTTTPTFTWTGISASDAVYDVFVLDGSYNQIWKKRMTGTSVVYSGPAFSTGTTYSFNVQAGSYSTCKDGTSTVDVQFTYVP